MADSNVDFQETLLVDAQEATGVSLSASGVIVRMDRAPQLGSRVRLEFSADAAEVKTDGIVDEVSGSLVTLRFPKLDPMSLIALVQYRNRHSA